MTDKEKALKIAVIQASSQAHKNSFIYETVKRYARDAEVINFGCGAADTEKFSYVEISLLIGLLLGSGAVDFVVTGCSSGQGMMLACNSVPGVLCGYAPTPKDAYLFCQINNGNAVSLPLGEDYTWGGYDNFEKTVEAVFCEPFGQGYPKSEAERKIKDTLLLKGIRSKSQVGITEFLDRLDGALAEKILRKGDVVQFVLKHADSDVSRWIENKI